MTLGKTDQAARDALGARLGKGARYDAPNAPSRDLLLARRGAAYCARKLNELADADLSAPSRVSGWSRGQLIADVSYRARAMAIALKSVRAKLTQEEIDWEPDLRLATTLPARALRYLYAHTDVHLNVEFRDLTQLDWEQTFPMGSHANRPVRGAPALRAQDVWLAGYNLGNGGRVADLPTGILAGNPTGIYPAESGAAGQRPDNADPALPGEPAR